MYTSNDQTVNLIELGFKKPKGWYIDGVTNNIRLYVNIDENPMMFNYSISELIEMLPMTITNKIWWGEDKGKEGVWGLRIDTNGTEYGWYISYERDHSAHLYLEGRTELVDALYDMVVKLKEEGVI